MNSLHVGFDSFVNMDKIVAVTFPDSVPVKKVAELAQEDNKLIDVTRNRKKNNIFSWKKDK